jgi:hypothetical protein
MRPMTEPVILTREVTPLSYRRRSSMLSHQVQITTDTAACDDIVARRRGRQAQRPASESM